MNNFNNILLLCMRKKVISTRSRNFSFPGIYKEIDFGKKEEEEWPKENGQREIRTAYKDEDITAKEAKDEPGSAA